MYRTKDTYGVVKYSGRSKAKVLDNRDPLSRGRILIDHPLLGKTTWVDYLKLPHQFDVPSIGDIVYVECDTGEYEFPVAWGNVTKGLDENVQIPQAFKRAVPTNRGMYSPGGHLIEIDDGESKPTTSPKDTDLTTKSRGIRITSSSGHIIHINDDSENQVSSITIVDKNGDGIVFDAINKKVSMYSVKDTDISAGEAMSINVGKAMTVSVPNDQELHTVKSFNVQASDVVQVQGNQATLSGDSMTTVGSSSSPTKVDGQQVMLAGGGPGVARLGDRTFGIGNLGFPVSSVIIQGSTKVTSG